jgi:hypothetical protein
MASEAQILANRKNAQKSTGPRTEEGKAVAAQNSVKHGLLGTRDVINSEDPAEFDRHRQLMLAQLDPSGPIERVLADRIVSLSWRLKRVERMQNEALDCLLAQDAAEPAAEAGELGSFVQTDDLALGQAAVKDFGSERVLERRIEHSLYKTINELDRMKLLQPFDRTPGVRGQGAGFRDQRMGNDSLTPEPRALTPRRSGTVRNEPNSNSRGDRGRKA